MPIGIQAGPKTGLRSGAGPYVLSFHNAANVPIPTGAWTLINDPAWVWAYPAGWPYGPVTARTPSTLWIQNVDPTAGQFLYVSQTNLFAIPFGTVLQDMFFGAWPSPPLVLEDMLAPVYVQGVGLGGTLANIIRLVRAPNYYA